MTTPAEQTHTPLVKFCGLSRPQDIEAVNSLHPDFAGFIVNYPPSRRSITTEKLCELREQLDPSIAAVGVFVDQDPTFIANVARTCALDYVQLHGGESEGDIERLRALDVPPIIKAFVVQEEADAQRAQASSADYVLLDNGKGTGQTFDWSLIQTVDRPYFLSGGLNKDTIAQALELHPFAIDVSSGIETDGYKDRNKMEALLAAVRGR